MTAVHANRSVNTGEGRALHDGPPAFLPAFALFIKKGRIAFWGGAGGKVIPTPL